MSSRPVEVELTQALAVWYFRRVRQLVATILLLAMLATGGIAVACDEAPKSQAVNAAADGHCCCDHQAPVSVPSGETDMPCDEEGCRLCLCCKLTPTSLDLTRLASIGTIPLSCDATCFDLKRSLVQPALPPVPPPRV